MSGMAVAPQVPAAEAAFQVLRDGGNAIDAAVTAAFVQMVVDPQNAGIAGFGVATIRTADGDETVVDFNGTAGSKASPDMWQDIFIEQDWTGYGYHLEGNVNDVGYQSIMTPGTVAGLAKILELRPHWRVMYVDIDVHHGDGVQWIFYDEPRVLTVSLHQSGRYLYPGTGFEDEIGEGDGRGTSINIPLPPFAGSADYLWALEEVLGRAAAAFEPHVLVTQLGADTHHGDPLANLGLTMHAYPKIATLLHRLAHDVCAGRWVATGGGGYQFDTVVPKAWTIHFAEMCGAPEAIPEEWLDDLPDDRVARSYRDEIASSVEAVLEACLPRLASLATSG
jgi:hypothetical protein